MELYLPNNSQTSISDLIIPIGDKQILIDCQAKLIFSFFQA